MARSSFENGRRFTETIGEGGLVRVASCHTTREDLQGLVDQGIERESDCGSREHLPIPLDDELHERLVAQKTVPGKVENRLMRFVAAAKTQVKLLLRRTHEHDSAAGSWDGPLSI